MKVLTNETKIRQRQRAGMLTATVGLLVAAVAAALVFFSEYSSVALLVLLVGFALSTVGTYLTNRWVRPPLPEKVLDEQLRRLDARHLLLNHFGPVPHLLLTPKGLIAIHPKRYEGPVSYDPAAKRWRGRFSLWRAYTRGLTSEGLGDPGAELAATRSAVYRWLQQEEPELADAVPIEVVALFVAPQTELAGVKEAPVLIAQPESIRKAIQGALADERPLPRESYRRLRAALEREGEGDALAETA